MYIYFDTNGTIKEIVNDKSIRNGSNEANKIYCYLEGEPEIDDIWYLQKLPSGELSNEVSFKNSTITKAIPYDAKRDMKYFKDFEQYKFYVFTLNTFLTSQKGLNIATIRVSVDNTMWALGELTFNVQENVINVDNGITQSQYDYLLLAYASRTLNEQVGRNLNDLIDDKIEAKLGDLASGSPKVFDTEANIEAMQDDEGIAVATDTGDIWVYNDTQQEYVNTGMKYIADVSLFYTKTESDNTFAPKSTAITHTGNQLKDYSGNNIYPNINADSIPIGAVGGVKINPNTSKEEVTNFSDYVTIETNVRYLSMDSNNMPIAQENTSYSTAFIDKSAFSGNIELHLASASGVPIFFINSIGKVVNIFTSSQIKNNTVPFTYNSEDDTFTIDINWLNSVPRISKVQYSMNNDNFYVGDTSFKSALNWLRIKYDNYDKKSIKLDCLDENLYLPKLIIPDVLYASVGNEFCIYKDDIFDCSNGAILDKFDLYWLTYDLSNNYALYNKVKTYDTHMSLVPTVSEVGEYKLKIQLKLNNVEVLSKVIRLIISNNTITSKTCIFIGDSFTASGIFPDKILSLCDGGITQLDRVGLSGWNTNKYLTREENNPFYNDGFDFSYYMNSKGFDSVDYVFINLGTNDITQTQNLTNTVANFNTMIESIHSFNSDIKIFVGIPTTPPKTQNSWYNQYNNVTVKMMRYRCFDLAKKMLEEISGTNIILVPLYITLDTVYDFPHSQMAVSYTNPELIDYISDPIHPNTYGYYKIANIIYSFLINLG